MKNIVVLVDDLKDSRSVFEAGADEIVIGVKGYTFSAIQKHSIEEVSNFSVLMNRFYFPSEIDLLKRQLEDLSKYDVNHIYFNDPAVYYVSKKMGIENKLIYKPDTLLVSARDAQFWISRGIAFASISPLITFEEITNILSQVEETEITIHGHILLSASKRKLLSSYLEKEDLKEKKYYLKEMKRDDLMPIYEDELGTLIYSDFVLNSFNEINHFHTNRFYIDGLFLKEKELVDAVKTYKSILSGSDASQAQKEYIVKYPNLKLSSGYYKEKTIK